MTSIQSNTTLEGKVVYTSGDQVVLRVTDLTTEDGNALLEVLKQPSTNKSKEQREFLDSAAEDGTLQPGDELVLVKIGAHRKLATQVTLQHMGPRKPRAKKGVDPEVDPDVDPDDGDDDI